jgi:hypothetical protein
MSVERFQMVLKLANLENDDKVWFGRWLRRYAVFLHQPENLPLLVSQQLVKQFCRETKVSGTVSRCNWRIRFLTLLFSPVERILQEAC